MKKHEKGGEKLPKGSKRTSRPGRDHREGPVQASQRRLRGFQKRKNLPKTMIFLDPDLSEAPKRLQEASRPGRDLEGLRVQVSQGGPDCSELLKTMKNL